VWIKVRRGFKRNLNQSSPLPRTGKSKNPTVRLCRNVNRLRIERARNQARKGAGAGFKSASKALMAA
jgi:hypothetical protein